MRIDSINTIPIKAEVAELLKNLNVGDTVKGRIVELGEGTVLLKTSGGQNLLAALTTDIKLQKGQLVTLLIEGTAGDKVLASIKEGSAKEPDLSMKLAEVLTKADIPVNDKNIDAAKLLVKYSFPVNKENLASLLQIQKSAASLGQTTGEGAVGLLLSELDLGNTPVETLNRINLSAEGEVKTLVAKLIDSAKQQASTIVGADSETPTQGASPAPTGDSSQNTNEGSSTKPADAFLNVLKQINQDSIPKNTNIQMQQGDLNNNSNGFSNSQESEPSPLPLDARISDILKKMDVELTPEVKQLLGQIVKTVDTAGKANLESIVFLSSKDMEVTPKNLRMLEQAVNSQEKVAAFLEKMQDKIDDKLKMSISNEDVRELKQVKEEISKLFLHPKQVEDKEAVKEEFKSLVRLGEKLESLLGKNSLGDADIRNTLTNLKDNIDFLKNINQFNNYLQIPVMMNNNPTTADVYVFKENKKGRQIDPQNATILVSLDLKYLGHLESMINLVQKQVNVTFRVQDKKIGELIESKGKELSNALEAKGYRLNPIKIIKLDQPFNLISLESLIQESNMEKIHFDMRV